MDNKLLLVTCITLLYRESQLPFLQDNSRELVREVISTIKLPELSVVLGSERDVMEGLINTATTMCNNPVSHQYEEVELLQRLKMNTLDQEGLYQTLVEGMTAELTEKKLKRICLNMRRSIDNFFKEKKVNEIMSKAQYRMKFEPGKITDMAKFISEVVGQLEPYQTSGEKVDPAIISEINISDKDGMAKVFGEIKNEMEGGTILRTGWQGINRMMDGGFREGENIVVGALQHNYKTGFTASLFRHFAIYNTPVIKEDGKKPLLLRISFEDTMLLNLQQMYKSLYENETGLEAKFLDKTEEELSEYVHSKLSVNGWEVRLLQVNPSMWTYRDICNKVLEYEAQGYRVAVCALDYLLKIPTTGCDQGPHGHDVRNLYERIYAFMKARGTIMITPHQLSTEAKRFVREGRSDFVKECIGKGLYAGCGQIDQVVDVEIFIHIEKVNGKSFLTVQRGKHRKIRQTPEKYLYCVLPFEDIGDIRDDFGKADTTRSRVGGGAIGGNESEIPWWDTP